MRQHPQTQGHSQAASQTTPSGTPSIPQLDPAPPAAKESHYCKPDRASGLLEWATFIVAGLGLWVFYGQWHEANSANDLNARNFRRDQRAWVVPFDTELRHTADGRIYFDFIMKNTGKTPALNFRAAMAGTSKLSDIPEVDNDDRSHLTVLATEAPYRLSTSQHPLTEAEMAPNRNGLPFMLYGTIRYKDIFGVDHWLQFCDQTSGDLTGFGPCSVHNKIDETSE